MRDFALPVVRVLVPLYPWSIAPHLAKQRENQARKALSLGREQVLYCRFEKRHGNLECAFSWVGRETEDRGLLGETVRDWLAAGDATDLLWCEQLAEGLALVLVLDGHVVKDGVYPGSRGEPELKLALRRLLRTADQATVYLGNATAERLVAATAEELESAERVEARPAPDTLTGYLSSGVRPPRLARLAEIPEINAWNRLWKAVRYAVTVAVLGIVGYAAYWGYGQLGGGEEEVVQQTPDRAKRNYASLLATRPAGDVLTAIHSAYRAFVGDPTFGTFSEVTEARWSGRRIGTAAASRAPSRLEIAAQLTVGDGDWPDARQAREFPDSLGQACHCQRLGRPDLAHGPASGSPGSATLGGKRRHGGTSAGKLRRHARACLA